MYIPQNIRSSISIVSSECNKAVCLLNREDQISSSFDYFKELINKNYFWKNDKRGKAVIKKEKRKLMNNANDKMRQLKEKIEKARQVMTTWNKQERSKWKDAYLLKNNESKKDMIYKKVQMEYNGTILRKKSLIMVNKDLNDVRMMYDMNTGITVSFGDLRTYSTNTKLAMKLRDARVSVNKVRDAIRSMYSFTQSTLLSRVIPHFIYREKE